MVSSRTCCWAAVPSDGMGAHSTLNCLLAHRCSSWLSAPPAPAPSFDRTGSATGGVDWCRVRGSMDRDPSRGLCPCSRYVCTAACSRVKRLRGSVGRNQTRSGYFRQPSLNAAVCTCVCMCPFDRAWNAPYTILSTDVISSPTFTQQGRHEEL